MGKERYLGREAACTPGQACTTAILGLPPSRAGPRPGPISPAAYPNPLPHRSLPLPRLHPAARETRSIPSPSPHRTIPLARLFLSLRPIPHLPSLPPSSSTAPSVPFSFSRLPLAPQQAAAVRLLRLVPAQLRVKRAAACSSLDPAGIQRRPRPLPQARRRLPPSSPVARPRPPKPKLTLLRLGQEVPHGGPPHLQRPLLRSAAPPPLPWRPIGRRAPACRRARPSLLPLLYPASAPPSSMVVAGRARSSRRCTSSRLCCLLAAGHPRRRPGFPCTSSLTPDLRPPPPRCPLAPCRPIWPHRPGSPWCYLAASSSTQVHLAASAVLTPLLLPWRCCHPWQICRCRLTDAVHRNTCRRWPAPRSPAPLLRVLVSCGHRPCIMPSTCTVP